MTCKQTKQVIIMGSASEVWVAATCAVPLADLLFLLSPATRTHENWVWGFDVIGLVVVRGVYCERLWVFFECECARGAHCTQSQSQGVTFIVCLAVFLVLFCV